MKLAVYSLRKVCNIPQTAKNMIICMQTVVLYYKWEVYLPQVLLKVCVLVKTVFAAVINTSGGKVNLNGLS